MGAITGMIDIETMDHTPRFDWAVFSYDEIRLFKELGLYVEAGPLIWRVLLHKYNVYRKRFGVHMPDTLRKHLLRELVEECKL